MVIYSPKLGSGEGFPIRKLYTIKVCLDHSNNDVQGESRRKTREQNKSQREKKTPRKLLQ